MNPESAIVLHVPPFREIPATAMRKRGFGAVASSSSFNSSSFLAGLGVGLTASALLYLALPQRRRPARRRRLS